jgi:hypothetical protein
MLNSVQFNEATMNNKVEYNGIELNRNAYIYQGCHLISINGCDIVEKYSVSTYRLIILFVNIGLYGVIHNKFVIG